MTEVVLFEDWTVERYWEIANELRTEKQERRAMTAGIVTYPEMNEKIVELLRWNKENPAVLYAATRIEELEAQVERLLERAQVAEAEVTSLRAAIEEVAIPSLLYCEKMYDHDDMARLCLEAGLQLRTRES